MNFFVVNGRIGNTPEWKQVGEKKTQVLNFSLAFDTGWKDKKTTTWVACALWGERADALKPYLTKGMPITVGGEIWVRKWTGGDGKEGASLEMNVLQLTLPPKPRDTTETPAAGSEDTVPF